MDAGDSARQKLERLRQQEAECETRLASLRKQIAAWERGLEGESKIAEVLSGLPSGWWVLHDRRKGPRSPANIDHIVIGPTGVHVIDTKNWSGRLWIGDKGVICGRTPMTDETRSLAEVRDLIGREVAAHGRPAPVFGVIALASGDATPDILVHEGIAFAPPERLLAGLLSPAEALTPEQAYRMWELLDDLHPPRATTRTIRSGGRSPSGRRRPGPSVGRPRATKAPSGLALKRRVVAVVAAGVMGLLALGAAEAAIKHLPSAITPATAATPSPTPRASHGAAAHRAEGARKSSRRKRHVASRSPDR